MSAVGLEEGVGALLDVCLGRSTSNELGFYLEVGQCWDVGSLLSLEGKSGDKG